jgi:hypothetical protein
MGTTGLLALLAPLVIAVGCSAPAPPTPTPLAEASHQSSCSKNAKDQTGTTTKKKSSSSSSSSKKASTKDDDDDSADDEDDDASLRLTATDDSADDSADEADDTSDDADKPKASSKKDSGSHASVTYESDIRKLIEDHCVSCHGAGGQEPKLTTRKDLDEVRRSVVDSIVSKSMPPEKALPTKVRNLASDWKSNGYKAGSPGEASVLGSQGSADATASDESQHCD